MFQEEKYLRQVRNNRMRWKCPRGHDTIGFQFGKGGFFVLARKSRGCAEAYFSVRRTNKT